MDLKFADTVNDITNIGYQWHEKMLLDNSKFNVPYIEKNVSELKKLQNGNRNSAIVVSAGPSLHNLDIINRIKKAGYNRTPSSQRECLRLWHRFPFPGARQQTFWSDSMSRIDV